MFGSGASPDGSTMPNLAASSISSALQPDLIDRIYESAFIPELWPAVLRDISEVAGARTGFMFVSRGDIHKWAASNQAGTDGVPISWRERTAHPKRTRSTYHR